MQALKISEADCTNLEDCTELIMELLSFGQKLGKDARQIAKHLRQEVIRITQGKARLILSSQDHEELLPLPVSASFPVRCHKRIYGTLEVIPNSARPASPAFPLSVAQLLAHTCGLLLYTLELTVFMEGQCRRLDDQEPGRLTKREREIMELICQGYCQNAIATKLQIAPATVETHRKNICEKLGVHSERDIPLAAYRSHLFSILT